MTKRRKTRRRVRDLWTGRAPDETKMTAKITFTASLYSFFADSRISVTVRFGNGLDRDRDEATDAEVRAAMEGSA